jgi:hypothetical protein
MNALMSQGMTEAALAMVEGAENVVTSRMINTAVSAMLASGSGNDRAAVEMFRLCEKHSIAPTASMFNNVLAALARDGLPEPTLSWIARMRDAGIGIDRVASNIQLKALAAMGNLSGDRAASARWSTPDALQIGEGSSDGPRRSGCGCE